MKIIFFQIQIIFFKTCCQYLNIQIKTMIFESQN